MTKESRVLVVFVASPSDLEPERNRLEEAIRELNLTWTQTLGVQLQLIRWETHGYPGIASDAQEVLNRQLPDDYDIFIGIMWSKFGTPTGRAGSGTQEEFTRALNRFRENSEPPKIMFYFKDAALAPSVIDPGQIEKVQNFRSSLGIEGVLYWPFVTLEEFERLARLHLARQVQAFIGDQAIRTSGVSAKSGDLPPADGQDDLGLLDLLDLIEGLGSDLGGVLDRINAETIALGDRMRERTREVNAANLETHGLIPRREAKILVAKAASDMDQYALRMKTEMPIFSEVMEKSMDAVTRFALMQTDPNSQDLKQVGETRDALRLLASKIDEAYNGTSLFQKTIIELPRLTSALNRSKRETGSVLEEMRTTLASGRREILETLKTVEEFLKARE